MHQWHIVTVFILVIWGYNEAFHTTVLTLPLSVSVRKVESAFLCHLSSLKPAEQNILHYITL